MFALHPVIAGAWKWVLLLVLAIVVAAALLVVVRSLRGRSVEPPDTEALLLRFQELYRDGKLSAEEFRAVRERLRGEAKQRPERGDANG